MSPAARQRTYRVLLAAVLVAAGATLVALGRREAIGYDSYWHVFIARQDRWPNFWREVRDNAHPPLFYLLLRAASAVFGPDLLTYRLVSIASTIAAAACIAAIVRRITANRPLAVVAAAAFGLSSGAIATGLEVRAYSMCAAFTMLAFVYYLDWFAASPHRVTPRIVGGYALAASVAVLTHYSTFFFLAAALGTPVALAVAAPGWRRRILDKVTAQPGRTAAMFGVPVLVAVGAYVVHVGLWGGGRLGHVPGHMFNPALESAPAFLWRNTMNLAGIVLPGGSEFVPGIYNGGQRVWLALIAVVAAVGIARLARPATPRTAAVAVVMLLAMIAMNAVGGLFYRYPYGGAARHEFFLVPFAVVALFSLLETVRRSLPARLGGRRLAAGVAACGVAASVASWTSEFRLNPQAMFQPTMDQFRRAVPSPRAVLLDQFSFINFFSHYHDWQWRAGAEWTGQTVRQIWSVTDGDRRIAVCRDAPHWTFDMRSAETYDAVVECGHRTGVSRVAIFGTHWWDGPPRPPEVDPRLAADDGLTTTAFVADGDDVSVEFEIDPAVLHDCEAAPPRPPDLHVVSNRDRVVTLAWSPVGGARTTYVIEAGLRAGSTDALNLSLGRTTTYTAARVAPATYYARVRAKNLCGASEPSSELRVVVP